MKKLSMIFAALAFTCAANAQLSLSGSFGIYNASNNTRLENNGKFDGQRHNSGLTGIKFSPAIGWAFSEDFEAGLILDVTSGKVTTRQMGSLHDNNVSGLNAALYGRRYFGLTDRFSLFAEAQLYGGIEKETEEGTKAFSKSNEWGISLAPGFSFSLSEHWSIESYITFIGLDWNNSYTADFDEDKKVDGNGTYNSTFNFGGSTERESFSDLLDGITIGLCYEF